MADRHFFLHGALELLDEGGSVIGQNRDIDSDAFLRCSRIEQSLSPGT